MRQVFVLVGLFLLLMSGALVSASEAEGETVPTASVRVLHLAPETRYQAVRAQWKWVAQRVEYQQLSPFTALEVGTYPILMNDVERLELTLEADKLYTLVLLGSAADDSLYVQVVEETNDEIIGSMANITVMNLLEDGTPFMLLASRLDWVRHLPADPTENANVLMRSIYAGLFDLDVIEAGTRNYLQSAQQVNFMGGERYVIAVTGTKDAAEIFIASSQYALFNSSTGGTTEAAATGAGASGSGTAARVVDGPSGYLRVANLSNRTPRLDVYVEGQRVASGIDNLRASDFFEIETGTPEVIVAAAATGINTNLFEPIAVRVRTGSYNTIAIMGDSDITRRVSVFAEPIGSIYDLAAAVTFVHAMPLDDVNEGRALDIYGNGIKLVEALNYPSDRYDGAFTTTVTAQTFEFEITPAFSTREQVFRAVDVTLQGDTPYLFALTGTDADPLLVILGPEGDVITRTWDDLPAAEATETAQNP